MKNHLQLAAVLAIAIAVGTGAAYKTMPRRAAPFVAAEVPATPSLTAHLSREQLARLVARTAATSAAHAAKAAVMEARAKPVTPTTTMQASIQGSTRP